MNTKPWWFHFAALGHGVGVGLASSGGLLALSAFIPVIGPEIAIVGGIVCGISTTVTKYADAGLTSVKSSLLTDPDVLK